MIGVSMSWRRASSAAMPAVANALRQPQPLGRPTPPERRAIGEVARLFRAAGQDQVAEAGQAHQRIAMAAQRHAQPPQFDEAARDERGAGAGSEIGPRGRAHGDGEHVLERAARFNAAQIVGGITAKGRRAEHFRQLVGQIEILGSDRHRRRKSARDVGGEGRTG